MTPYERLVVDRLSAAAAGIALPPRERWVPPIGRRGLIPSPILAASLVALVATAVVLGGVAGDAPGRVLATLQSLLGRSDETVPVTWDVFVQDGLLITVPADMGVPVPSAVPMFLGPNAPTLLADIDFDRGLTILVWKGTVSHLLDDFWLKQGVRYTRRPLNAPLHGEEIVTTLEAVDPVSGRIGSVERRNLFIQLAPDQIAHVILGPTTPTVPGGVTTISTTDRALEDEIATHLRAVADVDKHIDRTTVEDVIRDAVRRWKDTGAVRAEPALVKNFGADEWLYTWPNNSNAFAYVAVFSDRETRLRLGTVSQTTWTAPVAQRGVGNILVVIGSDDANVRYQILASLDDLVR